MMTKARNTLVSIADTPYYHCVNRCVRRAFLCGNDSFTGKSYEHRREWIQQRLEYLQSVFCIELCAYALMNNHYHLVIRLNPDKAEQLSATEVCLRWKALYEVPDIVSRYTANQLTSKAEMKVARKIIAKWRSRLSDISWYMRCLNEPIARRANHEDNCKGHFWEGRFKSQALLDEKALLQCMAYVDLNPIRAGISDTPEQSAYTSIQRRIQSHKQQKDQPKLLLPFEDKTHSSQLESTTLPFHFADYFELVDWSGRIIREGKRGAINHNLPPILERLNIPADAWLNAIKERRKHFHVALGSYEKLQALCQQLKQHWIWGSKENQRLFSPP